MEKMSGFYVKMLFKLLFSAFLQNFKYFKSDNI